MKTKSVASQWTILFACASLVLVSVICAPACTWFEFLNDKKDPFVGRTMEWPGDLNAQITIVPRNYDLGSFKTDYGFVGMSHGGVFSDGMNEHGMAVSALWLDSSKYGKNEPSASPITDLLPYVLGKTKTVDEAIAFIKGNKFYTLTSELAPGLALALHFAITDATGRSIVVEFGGGDAKIYENKVGVMTNDPPYDEQLRIWSQYDGIKFSEESFEGFNYSPEGRFCRMAAINQTQAKVPTDEAAVNRAWSMLNTVDIPQGILYWRWVNEHPQFTSYAVVGDLKNRVYFFRTYDNYDIRKVELGKIDFAEAKYKSTSLFGSADYREFKFK
jgi:penicillin V acylase-like amidase (Ntn superfamily)